MINLRLTDAQAFTLRLVLDRISGSHTESRRIHTEEILQQLINQDVPYVDDYPNLSGELYFSDASE